MADLSGLYRNDNIAAISTGGGTSAIAIIRCSGASIINAITEVFRPKNRSINIVEMRGYRQVYGYIYDNKTVVDDVVVSIYKAPNSFTGEDAVEINCHGSVYIQAKIMQLLMNMGIRPAQPGEFTMRAFSNGKFDLAQAEAIADLIDSHSEASHKVAMRHLKGNYSKKIQTLREDLLNFASLLELELDFSEEDIEFADRSGFLNLIQIIEETIIQLIDSYKIGKVLKTGIPVAIVGKPNVGKSTLLNFLLEEDKAITSPIPGTTRDVIEDTMVIKGYLFRFIDTAGIRQSEDEVENLGIERTFQKMDQASIIIFITDNEGFTNEDMNKIAELESKDKIILKIKNKIDLNTQPPEVDNDIIPISAKNLINTGKIIETLVHEVEKYNINENTIVTSARHIDALRYTQKDLVSIREGFQNQIPTDLIAIDVRNALQNLGEITGEITTDDLLGNIFGKFCIGK